MSGLPGIRKVVVSSEGESGVIKMLVMIVIVRVAILIVIVVVVE